MDNNKNSTKSNTNTSSNQYFDKIFEEKIYQDSRNYHKKTNKLRSGKISIAPSRNLLTQQDLALAYSPGVGAVSYDIYKDPDKIYDYTSKGNMVAVVSDGSAVLGLGDIGAAASLPVMEGKAVLFKKFADIDSIPIIIDTKDVDKIIESIALISSGWAGINLEDISSPRCFEIEKRLQEKLDIPVFHDDQHGTAIVAGAALLNALEISHQDISKIKMVMSGAGAAGIACLKFFISLGVKKENVIICDRDGVVYEGRTHNMDPIKSEFASNTSARTLEEAISGSNVFIGLSAAGVLKEQMLLSMAPNPIIFAMANPEPEIRPEIARSIRPDSIIATGRSDYPNQVNNVMGFPYIFRGALDVRAKKINEEMKIAAAYAIAELAKQPVHENVFMSYSDRNFKYGPEYIIPVPFDPRLLEYVTTAVAKAAIDSGVARIKINNFEEYRKKLNEKLDPAMNLFELAHQKVKFAPKKIIFAEGEEERIIQAALTWVNSGYGEAILIGDLETIKNNMNTLGIETNNCKITITNSALCSKKDIDQYIEYYYNKMCRKGILKRDAIRHVKTDRNIFASCMIAAGHGDGMITGLTRNYYETLEEINQVIDKEDVIFGLSAIINKGKTVLIADSIVNNNLSVEQIVKITIKTARIAQSIGYNPKVALLSNAIFGNPNILECNQNIQQAAQILHNRRDVDFEVDGEITADVALNESLLAKYPFCKLTSAANILIMPNLSAADIAQKMLKSLTDSALVGPILIGYKHPVQLISMGSSVAEIMNMAVLATSGILK